jgi:hypothetical protein
MLVTAACRVSKTPHPTPENVVPDSAITARITRSADASLDAVAARIRSVREVASVALADEAAGPQFIHHADDVSIDPDGNVFVLDAESRQVGVLDAAGATASIRVLAGDGGQTMGEGDVRQVVGVARGLVILSKPGSARVFSYSPAGYRRTARIELPGRPEDACSLGDELFVRIGNANQLVARLTADGRLLGMFADAYRVRDAEIRAVLSQGLIACVREVGTVVAMFYTFPEIYGFDAAGSTRWIARFEDFARPRLVQVSDPRHSVLEHSQPQPADRLVRLIGFHSRYVIVQIQRFSPDVSKVGHELHSYVLDASTGAGGYVGAKLPMLKAGHGGKLYAELKEPVRRLVMYETAGHHTTAAR